MHQAIFAEMCWLSAKKPNQTKGQGVQNQVI